MVYDAATDQVVLFGGSPGCGDYNSFGCSYENGTWIFNPKLNSWTHMNPKSPPPFEGGGAMAYDPALNSILYYGGNMDCTSSTCTQIGYWTYDPTSDTWTQLASDGIYDPVAGQNIENGVELVFDPITQHLLMLGGCWNWAIAGTSGNCWGSTSQATYEWNGGTSWTAVEIPSQNNGIYAAQALAALGITPGSQITAAGMKFTWPSVQPGNNNLIQSPVNGQGVVVPLPNAKPGASELGVLAVASQGPSSGTATLTYTDGTSAATTLGVSDIGLNSNSQSPSFGNSIAATMTYAPNGTTGINAGATYLFETNLPLDPTKTIASITLPSALNSGGPLDTFAFSTGTPATGDLSALYNAVGTSLAYPQSGSPSTDSTSGNPVLLQGSNGPTWTWNGSEWNVAQLADPMGEEVNGSLANDSGLGGVVLFGGSGWNAGAGNLDWTWLWNGSGWVQQYPELATPEGVPSPRVNAGFVYDSVDNEDVLFGGFDNNSGDLNDTWVWSAGGAWTDVSGTPPGTQGGTMAYDAATNQVVQFGGTSDGTLPSSDSTWLWNADSGHWSHVQPATSPPARTGAAMAYDASTGQVLLFGGDGVTGPGATGYLDDTWAWNGSAWVVQSPTVLPPPMDSAAMGYDPATGQLLLVGGFTCGNACNNITTWAWTGSNWQNVGSAPGLPTTSGSFTTALAYDPNSTALMLNIAGSTWGWNGTSWTQYPSQSTALPQYPSMGYDPTSGLMVLYSQANSPDTFLWDEQTQQWVASSPAADLTDPFVTGNATGQNISNEMATTNTYLMTLDNWGNTWGFTAQSTVPTAAETAGGSNPVEYATTCPACGGPPINTATGELWQQFTDFFIPGRGVNLSFSRTYSSSLASTGGPLGYGWTDNYNVFLTFDVLGDVTVHLSTGAAVAFTRVGQALVPPSHVFATLVETGNGIYDFTNANGSAQTKYAFLPSGQLSQLTDRNGYSTTLTYNSNSQLSTVTDPAGRQLTFTYNASGRIATVTDPASRVVTFGYNSGGDLTTVTNPEHGIWQFGYDTANRITSITDPRNVGSAAIVYNTDGQAISYTDSMSRKTSYQYADNGGGSETTTISDPNGNVTVDRYDYLELMSETRGFGTPEAATTAYTYSGIGLGTTSVTDPNGATTTYTYDLQGNVLSKTDPLGNTTSYTYDTWNDLLNTTDPLGTTTTNTYDQYGNLLSVSTPLTGTSQTAVTTYSYDPNRPGDKLTQTDPNGNTTTYTYDRYGNLITQTSPLGEVTSWTYNVIGEQLTMVAPKGNISGANAASFTTSYTYDPLGDLLAVADPLGHTTTYTYDADRNRTGVADALNNTTTTTYNADNQAISVAQSTGFGTLLQTTLTSYDANGNVLTQTNGSGNVTSYAYDPLNRVTSVTTPLGAKTSYTYDLTGNLLTTTDPSGRVTTDGYNADGQLTNITYSDGVTPDVSYTYDSDGQPLSMKDGTGTTSYQWNSLHQLAVVTNGAGATVTYGYDLAGDETSIAYPGAGTVTRGFNADEELISVSDWLGNVTELTYDPNGNLTAITYPNTVTETVSYDNVNQISTITDAAGGTSLLSEAYVRNADSQVTGQNSASVAYTAIHQVASSGLSGAQLNYTYDPANRLTQITNGSNATSLGYNAGSQLTSVKAIGGTTTYGFNSEGDRTSVTPPSKAAVTYTYDQAGRLTGVTAAGLAAAYSYNGNGLRMSKTMNGMAEQFSWDQSGSLPLVIQDGSTNFIYGPGGITLEQLSGTTPEYFMHDWQGSTLGLASTNGAIAASYSFDAYGNLTASAGSASTPLLFQGQYLDAETGFYYLQARYYDPVTGQFTAPDPATAVTGAPYTFAAGDPVNGSDPAGMLTVGDNLGGGYVPQSSASSPNPASGNPAAARFGMPAPGPSGTSTRSTSNKSHAGCSGIFCGFTSFVSTVGAFAVKHVGTIVSIAAIGTCIVGTLALCAALTIAAFLARSAQRYAASGSHSFGADAVDAAVTGASFGLLSVPAGIGGGALSEVNGGLGLAYRTFVELPDMIETGLFAAQANG